MNDCEPNLAGRANAGSRARSEWSGFELVVRGEGTDRIPEEAAWGSDTELKRLSLQKEACEAAGIGSLHGIMVVPNCRGDDYLYLHDWRDLDAAVRGIGNWMKCRNVGMDVVLRVEPVQKVILQDGADR